MVAPGVATSLGAKVGDTVRLPSPRGVQELTLVGILSPQPPPDQILLPLSTAQAMFDIGGRINTIDLNVSAARPPTR